MKPRTYPMRCADPTRAPFGDLFGDDAAMDSFLDVRRKMYSLGRMAREETRTRVMSKTKFDAWLSKIGNIGDDEPLERR